MLTKEVQLSSAPGRDEEEHQAQGRNQEAAMITAGGIYTMSAPGPGQAHPGSGLQSAPGAQTDSKQTHTQETQCLGPIHPDSRCVDFNPRVLYGTGPR